MERREDIPMNKYYEKMLFALKEMPILDVHSHISADRPQAGDISDILFYHFLRRELYSAGLPDDNYLVSDAPLEDRISHFFQYAPYIENTSTFWCVKKILEDIYEVPGGEISLDNWRNIQSFIESKKNDDKWPLEVLERARIKRTLICENHWNKENLNKYQFLIPLYEDLQYFNFDPTRKTSPLDLVKKDFSCLPESSFEFAEKIKAFFSNMKKDGIPYFASFISPSFRNRKASENEINHVYRKKISGEDLTPEEQNIFVTWLLYCYLGSLRELKSPAQFYVGAYWARPGMRYGESYVWTDHQYILDMVSVFKDFPEVKINLMYASLSTSQELIIVSRMMPNVSLLGFWWHTLFPNTIETIISQRLEALPANKWIAIATDAYSVEWAYGKVNLVLHCLAKVLSKKIEDGYLSEKKALWIAQRVLYDNPKEIYNL
jgi:glucuronate isomerase